LGVREIHFDLHVGGADLNGEAFLFRHNVHLGNFVVKNNSASCNLFERTHVDDKAIAHVFVHDSLESPVDVLGAHQFNVCLDVPGCAVVNDFLGFGDATDYRACKAFATDRQLDAMDTLKLSIAPTLTKYRRA
jgi:hypothetical protein